MNISNSEAVSNNDTSYYPGYVVQAKQSPVFFITARKEGVIVFSHQKSYISAYPAQHPLSSVSATTQYALEKARKDVDTYIDHYQLWIIHVWIYEER